MSIIQIMIDNCEDIFGDDGRIICNDNKKRSDDIKTSLNSAAGENEATPTCKFLQQELPHD
ncbi:mCG124788 [Mus musculus]|nr:mCG124788 [Mus musculus]